MGRQARWYREYIFFEDSMRILLSNDDGIYSPGLRALYHALGKAGHTVRVFAPASEQSGMSSCVTAFQPLRAHQVEEPHFSGTAVHGTPADSALLGMHMMGQEAQGKPDLVLSGINRGPNVGIDVFFSGTVGAAIQGALAGLPALALSNADFHSDNTSQSDYMVDFIEKFDFSNYPKGQVLNINFPACSWGETKPLRVCAHSARQNWECQFEKREDPYARPYWWMGNVFSYKSQPEPGTDKEWASKGHITLTPLRLELTDHENVQALSYLENASQL